MFLYGCERVRNKAVTCMFEEADHLPNASADFLPEGELGLYKELIRGIGQRGCRGFSASPPSTTSHSISAVGVERECEPLGSIAEGSI